LTEKQVHAKVVLLKLCSCQPAGADADALFSAMSVTYSSIPSLAVVWTKLQISDWLKVGPHIVHQPFSSDVRGETSKKATLNAKQNVPWTLMFGIAAGTVLALGWMEVGSGLHISCTSLLQLRKQASLLPHRYRHSRVNASAKRVRPRIIRPPKQRIRLAHSNIDGKNRIVVERPIFFIPI